MPPHMLTPHLSCVPPSMRAACPSHRPAAPKPCASSWQNPFLALVCPVPGKSFANVTARQSAMTNLRAQYLLLSREPHKLTQHRL